MKLLKALPTIPALMIVAACAQPEPAPIAPEPVYNKYDGGSCAGGSDSAGSNTICIPYTPEGYQYPEYDQRGGSDGGTGQGRT